MSRGGPEVAERAQVLSLELHASACVFLLMFISIGCGKSGNTVRVTGQLLKEGQNYGANLSGPQPETFVVDFVGTIDGRQYRFPATITPSGSFKVEGTERRGIPRGQYKINVIHSGFSP